MGSTSTIPAITNRQQDLLRFIYKFRFLNRSQIQTLMGHKDKRLINVWLKDLSQKSYLVQQYSKQFPENTKPAIYCSDLKAIRYFKGQGRPEAAILRLYRDRTRTSSFVQIKLLLADIAIELTQSSTSAIHFDIATSSDFGNPEALAYFFRLLEHSPDAVMTRTDMVDKTTSSYIIQMFPANYSTKLQYVKIHFYLDFYGDNNWQRYTGLQAHAFIFIFATHSQLLAAKRYFKRLMDRQFRGEWYGFQAKFLLANAIQKSGFIKTFDSSSYL